MINTFLAVTNFLSDKSKFLFIPLRLYSAKVQTFDYQIRLFINIEDVSQRFSRKRGNFLLITSPFHRGTLLLFRDRCN